MVGGHVVVAGVDVADLVGAAQCLHARQHYGTCPYPVARRRAERSTFSATSPPGVPPLAADRRAHAARRARGELLVPAPPGRLRVDRRARRRHARDRHGLRRGLRLGRARARGRERRRRRRQPRGPRARAAALPRAEPALRARAGRDLRRAAPTRSCSCRRSSTCRTRARCSSTSGRCSAPRRRRVRLDAQRADARAARARSARTTRGTCTSTAPRSSSGCAASTSRRSRCTACSTRASCALHELALRARLGPRAHARCG